VVSPVPRRFRCAWLDADVDLTGEREEHIRARHPDLLPAHRDAIREVLADPDVVRRSAREPAALLFSRWYPDNLHDSAPHRGSGRMAARLALQYDRAADILTIASRPPYPEQETEELGDDVIARLNPETGDVESLEILFFSRRLRDEPVELPVTADLRRSG
jgi:hypothetical protein